MNAPLQLVIGDKNLSSWSMRAWLAAKHSGLNFEEVLIPLDRPDTQDKILSKSPSGKVPCLIHGNLRIWDSLAICEYLNELSPEKNLWPKNPAQRALARSYAAEMHSGFSSLRTQLSMDIRLQIEIRHLTLDTISDINRILKLWDVALSETPGPFLFGEFSIADAFFAPVVFRFLSYGVAITKPHTIRYMRSVHQFPIVKEWVDAALKEEPTTVKFS